MGDKVDLKELIDSMKKDRQVMRQQLELQAKQQQNQSQLIQTLLEQLKSSSTNEPLKSFTQNPAAVLHKDLAVRMEKFVFDAEENRTFEKWYARYQVLFEVDAASLSDPQKVCLLTKQLSSSHQTDYRVLWVSLAMKSLMEGIFVLVWRR